MLLCFCWLQYLDVARHLAGYGEVMLPHCACDARKDGHVIAIAGATSFKLQACKEDGSPEVCYHLILKPCTGFSDVGIYTIVFCYTLSYNGQMI